MKQVTPHKVTGYSVAPETGTLDLGRTPWDDRRGLIRGSWSPGGQGTTQGPWKERRCPGVTTSDYTTGVPRGSVREQTISSPFFNLIHRFGVMYYLDPESKYGGTRIRVRNRCCESIGLVRGMIYRLLWLCSLRFTEWIPRCDQS